MAVRVEDTRDTIGQQNARAASANAQLELARHLTNNTQNRTGLVIAHSPVKRGSIQAKSAMG